MYERCCAGRWSQRVRGRLTNASAIVGANSCTHARAYADTDQHANKSTHAGTFVRADADTDQGADQSAVTCADDCTYADTYRGAK